MAPFSHTSAQLLAGIPGGYHRPRATMKEHLLMALLWLWPCFLLSILALVLDQGALTLALPSGIHLMRLYYGGPTLPETPCESLIPCLPLPHSLLKSSHLPGGLSRWLMESMPQPDPSPGWV